MTQNEANFRPTLRESGRFEQTTWHTGLPNRSRCARRGNIVQYMRTPVFSTADAFTGLTREELAVLEPRMTARQRQLLGLAPRSSL